MLKVSLENGDGNVARIDSEGALRVVTDPHPPLEDAILTIPFRVAFADITGATDMRVDGSVVPVEFCIAAEQERDIFIKTISTVISDQNATLNQFGNIGALANGVLFEHVTLDVGTTIIADDLISNFEFVRLAQGDPAFGDGTAAFRAGNISGNSEGYFPTIDFTRIFGIQWGLRLRKGTRDRLNFTVRDDLTGVDAFNITGYGIRV